MIKSIFFFLTGLLVISGCKKEALSPKKQSCYIIKEILPVSFIPYDSAFNYDSVSHEYIDYIYDEAMILHKRLMYRLTGSYAPSSQYYYYNKLTRTTLDSIIYDDQGLPEEIFHFEPMVMNHEKFTYTWNLLKRIDFVFYYKADDYSKSDFEKMGYEEFFYGPDNRLIRSEFNIKKPSAVTYTKTIKTYDYTNNNLSRIDIYNDRIDSSNATGYELYSNYDDKKNPFKYLFFLRDLRTSSLSENNYKNKKFYYKTGTSESSGNVEHVYKNYNRFGYPTDYPYFISEKTIEYDHD